MTELENRVLQHLVLNKGKHYAVVSIARDVGAASTPLSAISAICKKLVERGHISAAPWARPEAYVYNGPHRSGKSPAPAGGRGGGIEQQVRFLAEMVTARAKAGDPREYFEARDDAERDRFSKMVAEGYMTADWRGERKLYWLTGKTPTAASSTPRASSREREELRRAGLVEPPDNRRYRGGEYGRWCHAMYDGWTCLAEKNHTGDHRAYTGSGDTFSKNWVTGDSRCESVIELDNRISPHSRDICEEQIKSSDSRIIGQRGDSRVHAAGRTWTCWARKDHGGNHRAYDSSNEDPWGRRRRDEGWCAEWAQGGHPDNSRVELGRCMAQIASNDIKLRGQVGYAEWSSFSYFCYAARNHTGSHRAYDSSDKNPWGTDVGRRMGWAASWD